MAKKTIADYKKQEDYLRSIIRERDVQITELQNEASARRDNTNHIMSEIYLMVKPDGTFPMMSGGISLQSIAFQISRLNTLAQEYQELKERLLPAPKREYINGQKD
jgi:hypothetical protein